MQWKRAGTALFSLMFVSVLSYGGAKAEDPPLAFSKSSITVEVDETHELVLLNNTPAEATVALSVDPPSAGQVLALKTDKKLDELSLPAGGSAAFDVKKLGTAGGTVIAVAPDVGIARASFTIPAKAVAKPLVAKWMVTRYRHTRGPEWVSRVLPLRGAETCKDLTNLKEEPKNQRKTRAAKDSATPTTTVEEEVSKEIVGGVYATGSAASVSAFCTPDDVTGGAIGAKFFFDGLTKIGDYSGTIDLAPDDKEAGDVELTVRHTDNYGLPLVVLLLGVLAGWVVARRLGRLDLIDEGRERALKLLERVSSAERVFGRAAAANQWEFYTFKQAATKTVAECLSELNRLSHGSQSIDKDDPEYKAAIQKLEPVEALVAAWGALHAHFMELQKLLSDVAVAAKGFTPSDVNEPEPRFIDEAKQLLDGFPLEDTEAATKQLEKIAGMLKLAKGWVPLAQKVSDLDRIIVKLRRVIRPEDPDNDELRKAIHSVSEARAALWESTSPEVQDSRLTKALAEATAQLGSLRDRIGSREDVSPELRGVIPLDLPTDFVLVLEESDLNVVLGRPTSVAQNAGRFAFIRRAKFTAATAFTMLTATWTGFISQYADKAFGTCRDYVTIFIWGAGAEAILLTLAKGLDTLLLKKAKP